MAPVKVFIVYAHEDAAFLRHLELHLRILQIVQVIDQWHDGLIVAGERWNDAIHRALEQAELVLVLVSVHSMSSSYIMTEELPSALTKAANGQIGLIPILVGKVDWESLPISEHQALPNTGVPISNAEDDGAWVEVIRGIRLACATLRKQEATKIGPLEITRDQSSLVSARVQENRPGNWLKDLEWLAHDRKELEGQLQNLRAHLSDRESSQPLGSPEVARQFVRATVQTSQEPPKAESPILLTCQQLSKEFQGDKAALRFTAESVSFKLAAGQIAGVVGFNGTGKTTLLRLLAGELRKTTGQVLINDRDGLGRPIRNRVAFVPQSPASWSGLLGDHLRQQAAFWGALGRANEAVVTRVSRLLGLEEYERHERQQLSGGFVMRAAIAAAMVAMPGVLVLDEPLAPLDPRAQQQLLAELRSFVTLEGRALVLSSQHVPEVEGVADIMVALGVGDASPVARRRQSKPGRWFELSMSDDLGSLVRQLARNGSVQRFEIGETKVFVELKEQTSLAGAVALFGDAGLSAIRDVSDSALASMFTASAGERFRPSDE